MGKTYRKTLVLVQDGGGNARGNVLCVGNGLTSWGKAKRKAERKRARQAAKAEASHDHMMMLEDERQAMREVQWAEIDADLWGDIDNEETWYDDHDYYDPRDHDDNDDDRDSSWDFMDDPGGWNDYAYADGYYTRSRLTALETTPAPYGDDAGEGLGDILARALKAGRGE